MKNSSVATLNHQIQIILVVKVIDLAWSCIKMRSRSFTGIPLFRARWLMLNDTWSNFIHLTHFQYFNYDSLLICVNIYFNISFKVMVAILNDPKNPHTHQYRLGGSPLEHFCFKPHPYWYTMDNIISYLPEMCLGSVWTPARS